VEVKANVSTSQHQNNRREADNDFEDDMQPKRGGSPDFFSGASVNKVVNSANAGSKKQSDHERHLEIAS